MGQPEKEICIKCDEGGDVLACADSYCPIAVHERCMGCPARFDSLGKFYCPYCLYKKSVAILRRAKEHVLSKKQALRVFLDIGIIGNNKEMPSTVTKSTCERADELLPEEKNDVPQSNCDQQWAVGKRMHSCPVDTAKDTAMYYRVLETGRAQVNDLQEIGEDQLGKSVEVHNQAFEEENVGNELQKIGEAEYQLEKSVEDHNQVGNLSNSCVAEEEKMGNELLEIGEDQPEKNVEDQNQDEHLSNSSVVEEESLWNDIQDIGETRLEESVEDLNQDGHSNNSSVAVNTDPSLQHYLKGKRRAETGDSACRKRKSGKRVKKSEDERVVTDTPQRLTRTSASLFGNCNVAGKLVQDEQPPISPVELKWETQKSIVAPRRRRDP